MIPLPLHIEQDTSYDTYRIHLESINNENNYNYRESEQQVWIKLKYNLACFSMIRRT